MYHVSKTSEILSSGFLGGLTVEQPVQWSDWLTQKYSEFVEDVSALNLLEDIQTIVAEEIFIEELMIIGMENNFKALAEILVGCVLSEPISNIINLTSSTASLLNTEIDDWKDFDDRDISNEDDYLNSVSEQMLNQRIDDSEYSKDLLKLSALNVNQQILGNMMRLNRSSEGSGALYNIRGRNLEDIRNLQTYLNDSESQQLLEDMIHRVGSADLSVSSAASNEIAEAKGASVMSDDKSQYITNEIDRSGLFSFTKKVIFGEILNLAQGSDVTLFGPDGQCYLYDIAEISVDKLLTIFINIYKKHCQ